MESLPSTLKVLAWPIAQRMAKKKKEKQMGGGPGSQGERGDRISFEEHNLSIVYIKIVSWTWCLPSLW